MKTKTGVLFLKIAFMCPVLFLTGIIFAQDNYEIQVYPSITVEKNHTMFELHSNYTAIGSKTGSNDVFYSDKLVHETLEITHGFTDWFETGIYLFTSEGSNGRTGIAGTHIRPRVRFPNILNIPLGFSLSGEAGYQRLGFFGNHWSAEIRPIIDMTTGIFYFSLNPTFGWTGDKAKRGWDFGPSMKASIRIQKSDWGIEYYSGLGYLRHFDSFNDQSHTLYATLDYNFGENWEFNAGVGYGLTAATDRLVLKCIIGRRIGI